MLVLALLVFLVAAFVMAGRSRVARSLVLAALSVMALTMTWRWTITGHPPVFGTFEMDLAETLLLLASGLLIARKVTGYLRPMLVVAALTLAHTFVLDPSPTPLTISEVSLWIDLHAVLAWVTWACLFHALLLSMRADCPEDLALRLLGWGFASLTAMGFVGVYYGTILFATPWSWDPVQTLGLLTWLLAGASLHFRLFFAVTMRRQRWFLLVVVASFVLSGKLMMFLPPGQTFHVFELGVLAGPGP